MLELAQDISEQDIALFLQEAEELLALLNEDIVKLEEEQTNASLLQEIFRASHTLKGSSATLGHTRMAEMAHHMENLLDGVRKGTLPVTSKLVDILLSSLDALNTLKQELITHNESDLDISSIVASFKDILETPAEDAGDAKEERRSAMTLNDEQMEKFVAATKKGLTGYRIRVAINKKTQWAAVRCFQIIDALMQIGEVIGSIPTFDQIQNEKVDFEIEVIVVSQQERTVIIENVNAIEDVESVEIGNLNLDNIDSPEKNKVSAEKADNVQASQTNQTVRVNVSRLDTLMEQIGELVVNRNRLHQLSRMLEEKYKSEELIGDLGKMSTQVGKIVNEIQQDIMKIRMLPIEVVFNGFPRMVRDMARDANKKIAFVIEGQETEVDRSVIEHLRDPLVHIIRNAVDHGVETIEERKTAGKSEKAQIRLAAYHEENQIVITIDDDGRGLDAAKIKDTAVKKKLITAENAKSMNEKEAMELIFLSGLSTAKKTTEISGRGVGMDVVKTNIENINGSIAIDSTLGKGTRFTIRLPLTLAIVPSLLVSVSDTLCAIPLSNIVETVRLDQDMVQTVRGKEVMILRGSVIPIVRLAVFFGWSDSIIENNQHIDVVIVKAGNDRVGLVVDSLIEQQEIVIKSLGMFVNNIKGFAGASILGDGRVALVMDITSLLKMVAGEYQQSVKNIKQRKDRTEESKPFAPVL